MIENLYERKEQFFMNKIAIKETGQALTPLYNVVIFFFNSVTSTPEDGWSDQSKYCYKYITLCQPCSSL